MCLVYYNNDLTLCIVAHIVIAVLDYLIIKPLEHKQHLCVCNGSVLVGKERLEVEHDEILVRGDGSLTIPEL